MSGLLLPSTIVPSNLVIPPEMASRFITSDLYDIAGRVKEIDERLFICYLGDARLKWGVGEHCTDGVDRLVCKAEELDGRVLKHLGRIMSTTLASRIDELEKECASFEREEHERELDELYETVGGPMASMLERCGFTETRGVSYPKHGVAGGKGSLSKT